MSRFEALVQELIVADVTAVVFSVNPVNGERGEIVINANWGLGECLVDGRVTPDMYVVHREDRAILSRSIARKRRMTTVTSSGTREVDVPAADWMWRRVAASASWACRTSRCAIEPPRASK